MAELHGELAKVRQDGARRLSLSAERKDQTQKQLVEQLKEVSEEFSANEKEFKAVSECINY